MKIEERLKTEISVIYQSAQNTKEKIVILTSIPSKLIPLTTLELLEELIGLYESGKCGRPSITLRNLLLGELSCLAIRLEL